MRNSQKFNKIRTGHRDTHVHQINSDLATVEGDDSSTFPREMGNLARNLVLFLARVALRDARHFSPFDSMGAHAGAIALSSSRQHEPSDSRQDEHLPGARRLRVELSA
jgi:hypothetical protein